MCWVQELDWIYLAQFEHTIAYKLEVTSSYPGIEYKCHRKGAYFSDDAESRHKYFYFLYSSKQEIGESI